MYVRPNAALIVSAHAHRNQINLKHSVFKSLIFALRARDMYISVMPRGDRGRGSNVNLFINPSHRSSILIV